MVINQSKSIKITLHKAPSHANNPNYTVKDDIT